MEETMSQESFSANPEEHYLYDVVIIGAGPCGLAVAARLCEQTPSALFTDEEHQRYHWIRKHGRKMNIMNANGSRKARSNASSCVECESNRGTCLPYRTVVLDATSDQWMAKWTRLFTTFEIGHLRSPMFFHVDPKDRDGLLAFAYEQQREDELREITNCVGKETSKHRKKKQRTQLEMRGHPSPKARLEIDERDRKDYFAPSLSLFNNYCQCVVDRYCLTNKLVRREAVQDIDFGFQESVSETQELFKLTTNRKVYYARSVVVAVGAGNAPAIPRQFECGECHDMICHSNQIKEFPAANVARKIQIGEQANIMIIGGGLTSAQLADLAIRRGVSRVWHLMRGGLKIKPFDVNLEWMGKFQNHEKAMFWFADSDEERLDQIRKARNGGSITPFYEKILRSHISTGALSLHNFSSLTDYCFDVNGTGLTVTTNPPIPGLPAMDFIYFATGIQSDFTKLPFLQTMLDKYPLHAHGGFPCLSDDLMWRGTAKSQADMAPGNLSKVDIKHGLSKQRCKIEDPAIPLFVTGRLASLRLGPGAGNLEGARLGAERIAWALQEFLKDRKSHNDENGQDGLRSHEFLNQYSGIFGNRFEALGLEGWD